MPKLDLKINMSLNIKPADVEAILQAYVEDTQPGYTVVSISHKLSWAGSQRDDYQVYGGCDVVLRPKKTP